MSQHTSYEIWIFGPDIENYFYFEKETIGWVCFDQSSTPSAGPLRGRIHSYSRIGENLV